MQTYSYIYILTLHMVNYQSQYQLKFTEFNSLNNLNLKFNNRWIQLGAHLPWDNLVKIYSSRFNTKLGAKGINPRIIIGSFIIKHKLNLSDEEILAIISENPYMQFFLGLGDFYSEQLFSPTLFVELRKRLSKSCFDEFSDELIRISNAGKDSENTNTKESKPKGKLKLDATVADQYISYPNDLGLVNEARIKTEKMIDVLFDELREEIIIKPRTYRTVAHKRYMSEAKKRQKNKVSVRKTIRVLLNCVKRNIRSINKMLDELEKREEKEYAFPFKYYKQFWVINTLYEQQQEMYDKKENRCSNRIINISQPHIRPIVRGKQGKNVEFGSKLGVSLANGYAKPDTLSWDAYNESSDLPMQAEAYKTLYGYYPELIQVDKIYGTNQNRTWCKQRDIRMTVTPKGKQQKLTKYQKAKRKKEYSERNAVEGKFGQAKQAYKLNEIKAKLKNTSKTWIGAIFFVLNCVKFASDKNFTF